MIVIAKYAKMKAHKKAQKAQKITMICASDPSTI